MKERLSGNADLWRSHANPMKKSLLGEAIVPAIAVAFGISYFIQTTDAPEVALFWPIVTVAVAGLLLLLVVVQLVSKRASIAASASPSKGNVKRCHSTGPDPRGPIGIPSGASLSWIFPWQFCVHALSFQRAWERQMGAQPDGGGCHCGISARGPCFFHAAFFAPTGHWRGGNPLISGVIDGVSGI